MLQVPTFARESKRPTKQAWEILSFSLKEERKREKKQLTSPRNCRCWRGFLHFDLVESAKRHVKHRLNESFPTVVELFFFLQLNIQSQCPKMQHTERFSFTITTVINSGYTVCARAPNVTRANTGRLYVPSTSQTLRATPRAVCLLNIFTRQTAHPFGWQPHQVSRLPLLSVSETAGPPWWTCSPAETNTRICRDHWASSFAPPSLPRSFWKGRK